MSQILGSEIFNSFSFFELLFRFGLNFLMLMLLVRWLYYGMSKRKDYLFTYMLIGTIVFLLCYILESVKVQLGFALGMFAIFGIIRYRTDAMPIKEMTYLFLVIGLSIINSISSEHISIVELLFTNIVILSVTFGLEKIFLLKHESAKAIRYEKIELIKPENRTLLLEDLKDRTGIKNINRVEIGKIDFLRDTANIIIYYYQDKSINIAELNDRRPTEDDDED